MSLDDLIAAHERLARVAVQAALDDVYKRIQSLGGPGLHVESLINRGAALKAVRNVMDINSRLTDAEETT